jgi:hypothetical protein
MSTSEKAYTRSDVQSSVQKKTRKIIKPSVKEEKDLCAICLGDLNDGQETKQLNTVVLPNGTSICGHEFHKTCINAWMNSDSVTRYNCPVCQTPISVDQRPQAQAVAPVVAQAVAQLQVQQDEISTNIQNILTSNGNVPFITILVCSGNTKIDEVLNTQVGLRPRNTINDVLNIVNAMKGQILQQIINNQNLFRRGLQHVGICSRPNDIRINSITPTIPGRCTGIPGFNHFNYTNGNIQLIDAYRDGLTMCKNYLRRDANPFTQNYASVKNAIKPYINNNGIEEDYYFNPELIPEIPLEFRPTGSEIVTPGLIPPQLANIPYDENGSIRISSVPYASKVPILCLKIDISAVCDNSGGKKSRKSKKKSKKFRKKCKKSRKKSRK